MLDWTQGVPRIELALVSALLVAALLALVAGRRGGRMRALPGWAGFWVVLAAILIGLARAGPWVSFFLLLVLMFVALRTYFSIAPVRPGDSHAIAAAYLAIPFALWVVFTDTSQAFLSVVPVLLFLLFPALLSVGPGQRGLLDAVGRVLLGVLLFVFCAAHLGLIARLAPPGLTELFGLLVLAAELPQRLAGRWRAGAGWIRPGAGVAASLLLAVGLGFWVGPWCGLVEEDAARAGALVVFAVTTGALVTEALARDLELGPYNVRMGRAAFLDRSIPAVYAAPVFFHYLNHFA